MKITDTMRLDWLQKNKIPLQYHYSTKEWQVTFGESCSHKTARKAIDAEMKIESAIKAENGGRKDGK